MDQNEINQLILNRVQQIDEHVYHRAAAEIQVMLLQMQINEVQEGAEPSE